ncbi:MAG: sigma-54 dependent transcriptional regulator [Bacteroidota bacterium]
MAKKTGAVLIVDDDPEVLLSAKMVLKREFQQVKTERNPQRILNHLKENRYQVVLLDLNFSQGETDGREGIKWIKKIRSITPETAIVAITAYGHIEMAVNAMKAGASDFISKPWENQKLLATARKARDFPRNPPKDSSPPKPDRIPVINRHEEEILLIGSSEPMRKLNALIQKIGPTNANVLILGENGTGKELIAHSLHQQSLRKDQSLVTVDLGALPVTLFESELFGYQKGAFTDAKEDREGKFSVAHKGTLFLDEIGNLPLAQQAKLLTALQSRKIRPLGSNNEKPVDIRLICATNADIHQRVQQKTFRQDLLYRINTVEIYVPPLRDRTEDILLLADHFLDFFTQKYNKGKMELSARAQTQLTQHTWPGNVRELMHSLERVVILSESTTIESEYLALGSPAESTPDKLETLNLEKLTEMAVRQALKKHQGNITRAAEELGLTRAALYRRMEKFNL